MLYWLSVVMAEGSAQADVGAAETQEKQQPDNVECAVCLQPCIHPAQLPCGHIFCFLCVKGIANQSKRCAMCRQEIPRDFIEHPKLLQCPDSVEGYDGGYQWFYEGRNGWWQYDPRTNEDIEEAFKLNYNQFEILICGETYIIDFENKVQYPKKSPSRKRFIKRDTSDNVANFKGWWQYDERTSRELETCYKAGERTCELLIAGFLYDANLDTMLQMRRNDHSRRRRIKRDFASAPKKGVAGLRTESDQSQSYIENPRPIESHRPHSPSEGRTDNLTPITPSNTPQTPASGRESPHQEDLEATIERIRSLRLVTASNSVRPSIEHNEDEDGDVHLNANNSREEYRAPNFSRFQF